MGMSPFGRALGSSSRRKTRLTNRAIAARCTPQFRDLPRAAELCRPISEHPYTGAAVRREVQVMSSSPTRDLDGSLLDELSSLVSRAGAAILALRAGSLEVQAKADHSPVTVADQASEAVMVEGISRLLPGVSIVSEEAVESSPPSKLAGTFLLVDPLDGTREFIAGRDEFTINLALVTDGSPR